MPDNSHRLFVGTLTTLALVVGGGCATGNPSVATSGAGHTQAIQQTTATAGPEPATTEPIELWRDGIRLAGTLDVPAHPRGAKVPLVIVMHGFSGNQNEPLIRATGSALYDAGMATIRFDFDGHGASGGRQRDMTVPGEIEDARVVYNYARALPFVSTIGFAGHSQGGVVAAMLAGELGEKIGAVALFAPASIIPEIARSGSFLGTQFDPANPPESITSVNDYRIGRDYILTAQTLPLEQVASQYAGPVTIIQGAADEAVPPAASRHFVTVFRDGELHELPGQDHIFTADPRRPAALAADFLSVHLR